MKQLLFLLLSALAVSAQTTINNFVPITPCRAVDTRVSSPAAGGGALLANVTRTFTMSASTCKLPWSSVVSYAATVSGIPNGGGAYWGELWPSGQQAPGTVTFRATSGAPVAVGAILTPGPGGSISAYVAAPATVRTDIVVDISGYWIPVTISGGSGQPGPAGPPGPPGPAGSGGATYSSQLGDFVPVLASGTLTLNPKASATLPVIARVPCTTLFYRGTAPAAATVTTASANDTAYGYIDNGGVLTIGTSSAAVTCTNCKAVTGVTAFPAGSMNLFTWTITSGAFVPGGYTDFRSFVR